MMSRKNLEELKYNTIVRQDDPKSKALDFGGSFSCN